MIIIEKNEGTKIFYEEVGNKICFDDDLTINLAKREEDHAVHIDICYDKTGELVIGAAAGRSYVAEIDIPQREYTHPEADEIAAAESTEDGAALNTNSVPSEPVPFDMGKVTLTLWAIN